MKENKFDKWLNNVDNKAEEKGRKTIWQIVKFVFVSLLVTLIQLALVNLLYFFMKSWNPPLPPFLSEIFSPSTVGEGHSNWGYLLPFFLSNLIANTVGYFLNKKKTFKSNAPIWYYVVYLVFLFLLILFTTWVQGVIVNALTKVNFEALAPTIASMVAGTIQMLVLFPLQKFVLLKESKEVYIQKDEQ